MPSLYLETRAGSSSPGAVSSVRSTVSARSGAAARPAASRAARVIWNVARMLSSAYQVLMMSSSAGTASAAKTLSIGMSASA